MLQRPDPHLPQGLPKTSPMSPALLALWLGSALALAVLIVLAYVAA
jgi:hypothetical protein